jgi:hypothetical protein
MGDITAPRAMPFSGHAGITAPCPDITVATDCVVGVDKGVEGRVVGVDKGVEDALWLQALSANRKQKMVQKPWKRRHVRDIGVISFLLVDSQLPEPLLVIGDWVQYNGN